MKVLGFITTCIAWFVKNLALIVGVVEAIAKVVAGVVSLAPIKSKDVLLQKVDNIASNVKKVLYTISDFLKNFGGSASSDAL